MIRPNSKSEIVLTNKTLGLQLCKRRKAFVLRFLGEKEETSDETLKRLMEVMKSVKTVRKVIIECKE